MQTRDQHSEHHKPESTLQVQVPLAGMSSEIPHEVNLANTEGCLEFKASGNHRFPRVKTRILNQSDTRLPTPEQIIERKRRIANSGGKAPLGSIAIIDGLGRGAFFDLTEGFTRIGRAATQEIQLSDDHFISRENHAIIGYVPGRQVFYLFDGGKENPIWDNNELVLDVIHLRNEDIVKIGKTTLLFIVF